MKRDVGDADHVAGLQDGFGENAAAVDEGAVRASQIADPQRVFVFLEDAMMPAEKGAGGAQVAIAFGPDQKAMEIEADALAAVQCP